MADINPPDRREKARNKAPEGQERRRKNTRGHNSRSGEKNGGRPQEPRQWRRPPHKSYRQAYAAIDLGTNNCRLLIARPADENFVVIDAFSRVVRLGEGLAQTGRLSDEAMDRALGALKVCSDKLRKRNVHLARSVATEACRRASNGEAFIERVREETGIVLDIISAQEEARLAVLGCHILLEDGIGPAIIFDIGGGSTELVLIEPGAPVPRILDWQSVPWGVVSLSETVGKEPSDNQGRLARYAKMKQLVLDSFAEFAKRIDQHKAPEQRLLGTSGTVTTLASVHLGLPQYDRKAVDGLIVPSASMREISQRLSGMSPAERSQLDCIGADRADLVVAGCAILEAILDIWPAERLGVADRGIREGILRSLMAADAEGAEAQAALRRLKQGGAVN
ncbi:Ppx/GppA phosphatase family protein [Aurantiacibacter sp. MUD11]|uniref:Ppx/GppA phosphatase family protein n=1 Tax=Aurantiacibacter sp. MUD11 TaxID=3003265 RepID=UPI0022AA4BDE|nr:Ppx/GppA phosphatase family protein [Aurantiacibacter sp. MUD11]WAT16725.1 Ppx/GppA phosphatase family protein [Aurantiacibacter sp. MUD11]